MRLSLDWLSAMVTWTERDPEAIARRITLSIAEIEDVERQGILLEGCCVGRIAAVLPHPNAQKLRLADVETDRGMKRVVCGGTNLKEGMLVAFAHSGATVRWHGEGLQTLAPATIRGEESHGMICAAEELDLQELLHTAPEDGERPIMDLGRLHPSPQAKTPLREALGQTDVVFHVNNTAITNRPDLFSHLGFARECVAAGLAKWKGGKPPAFRMPKGAKTPCAVRMKTEAKGAVTRYLACAIDIAAPGVTPEWMKRRLVATGFRPLLLPVDITNYVSHEVGMPLHSFDIDDLRGTVRCRYTEEGETMTTLDGAARALPQDTLVLSDDDGIFDLMGIMGGLRSSTKETTRRIYLHAAVVDPAAIRRATAALNHRTDASTVYEKGIPAIAAEWGLARAVELFLELVPGATVVSPIESVGTQEKAKAITLPHAALDALTGGAIQHGDAKRTLTALGCTVKASGKNAYAVTPPPWRTKDLRSTEELLDDVCRLHGYDRLQPTVPLAPVTVPPRDFRTSKIRHALAGAGYAEIVPLSLIGQSLLEKASMRGAECRRLASPLSEDLSLLQPSTLPGLLLHAEQNLLHAQEALRTFRIATVFEKNGEHVELGALVVPRTETELLNDPLLTLKQAMTQSLRSAGITLAVRESTEHHPWMHPGRSAELWACGEGEPVLVGHMSDVHPDVASRFGLPRAAAALLHWSAVLALRPVLPSISPAPAFPGIVYDVTVARTHNEEVGPLLRSLRSAHPLVEQVVVQDLFHPPRNASYRLTLRFTYRAPDRTLTEEEAKNAHDAVLKTGHLTPLT